MLDKKVALHYLKRYVGSIMVTVVLAAVFYNAAADDLRLLRQIDNNYEGIMLAPENNAETPALVNINTASVHHLQRIKGIGETKARAIVEYREAHGGFKSIDELVNVSGIGGKTIEEIRDMITI